MASANLTPSGSSMSNLLTLYMQGQITERQWKRMMRIMDSRKASKTERMAIARYFRDVVSEKGSSALRMPKLGEVNDMLGYARNS